MPRKYLIAVLAATATITGCSTSAGKPAGPAAPSAASASIPADMAKYIEQTNKANEHVAEALTSANARPTVADQSGRTRTMVIRDEGGETLEPGRYRLVVYCTGSGTLYATFRLGQKSQISELPPCETHPTTGVIELSLDGQVIESSVIIMPAGNALAAVAYQIQRV